jgi:hypothetical protein
VICGIVFFLMPSPRAHGSAIKEGVGFSGTKLNQTPGQPKADHTNKPVLSKKPNGLSRFWNTEGQAIHSHPPLVGHPG